MVNLIIVKIDDPRHEGTVSRATDALFENSQMQTRTHNEQVNGYMQMRQVGDVGLIANGIIGAVLFTLLFVTASTMMQSVRERVPELAVLKSLGFSDSRVLLLVLAESLALCVIAALLGLLVSTLIYPAISKMFGSIRMPPSVLITGIGVASLVAIVSGLPAALRARGLSIAAALADR